MTNAEKYKDAIMAQMCKTGTWTLNKYTNEIDNCTLKKCRSCMFSNKDRVCIDIKAEWLNTEAVGKKAFSEKDKEVIRALDKIQWVARDESGILYGYHGKPYKSTREIWFDPGGYVINLTTATTAEFAPIKREDDEPTSRAEILGEEK